MASYVYTSTHRIKSNLYLGDAKLARSNYFLTKNNIRAIINATTSEPNAKPESYEYLSVKIDDEASEIIYPFFQIVFEFIRRHLELDHSVLVHCQMGVSRSATLVIAYLMIDGPKTLGEAFQHVKSIRPQIDPNDGFMKQLRELEQSLFGQTVTLGRLTAQDLSIEESSRVVMDRALRLLANFVIAFAGDASPQTLDLLKEKLLQSAEKVKGNDVLSLLSDGICKCLRMFGGNNLSDQEARSGVEEAITAMCIRYGIDADCCLSEVEKTTEWQELCIDIPLVREWMNDVRQRKQLK